jgi:hypothetical protein
VLVLFAWQEDARRHHTTHKRPGVRRNTPRFSSVSSPTRHTPSELSNLTMLNPRLANGSAALLPAGRTAYSVFCVERAARGRFQPPHSQITFSHRAIGYQCAAHARAALPESAKLFPPRA